MKQLCGKQNSHHFTHLKDKHLVHLSCPQTVRTYGSFECKLQVLVVQGSTVVILYDKTTEHWNICVKYTEIGYNRVSVLSWHLRKVAFKKLTYKCGEYNTDEVG